VTCDFFFEKIKGLLKTVPIGAVVVNRPFKDDSKWNLVLKKNYLFFKKSQTCIKFSISENKNIPNHNLNIKITYNKL